MHENMESIFAQEIGSFLYCAQKCISVHASLKRVLNMMECQVSFEFGFEFFPLCGFSNLKIMAF
jgi:hypothetical protein